MTVLSSRNALKRRTWALFMFFFLPGLLMASWATRTPAIRDILSVSTAEMGAVLFGLSIGSMSGILCSAWLGETIWHPEGYSHDDDLRSRRDGYS
ncbi:MFS transporter [Salmonella enterica subsp. enterica serovar Hessarek]|nr:MFS transporter [Salmonella enterica subsp. enterica serovar Hessarek]EHI3793469.1 MFS transporter [Salmonella enterica]EHJ2686003.1 MFS transporter [Salmonella enterica]